MVNTYVACGGILIVVGILCMIGFKLNSADLSPLYKMLEDNVDKMNKLTDTTSNRYNISPHDSDPELEILVDENDNHSM